MEEGSEPEGPGLLFPRLRRRLLQGHLPRRSDVLVDDLAPHFLGGEIVLIGLRPLRG